MCIRDRFSEEDKKKLLNDILKSYDEKSTPLYAAARLWVDAVSYTHLRAHETVLDLVCRLLLENKKHKPHDSLRSPVHSKQ